MTEFCQRLMLKFYPLIKVLVISYNNNNDDDLTLTNSFWSPHILYCGVQLSVGWYICLLQLEKSPLASLINKPDRATMRPDCVSTCIDHVTYMERQMDEQTGETTKW